jgi:8-oxo-dGTP diphosphatase
MGVYPQRVEKPNGAALYTIIVLRHGGEYLLLERAAAKRMHPGLWTGMGGRVEADEMGDLTASALRELHEESGIGAHEVTNFTLRRVVFHARPGAPLTTLLYFTGTLMERVLPSCPEGTLAWICARAVARPPADRQCPTAAPAPHRRSSARPGGK